jgi:hypothetical protein
VLIDERVDVDVMRVVIGARGGKPVRGIEGTLELREVIGEPAQLAGGDFPRLRFMDFQGLPGETPAARGEKIEIPRAVLILLEHVAACDLRLGGVGRRQFGDVCPWRSCSIFSNNTMMPT